MRSMNPLTAVQFFRQWWFLFAALGSMTVSGLMFGINLSARVEQLMEKSQVDDLQRLNINANTRRAIDHQARLVAIEVHMGPRAIQRWGQIQATSDEDHRLLSEHLRNHPRNQ